MGSQEIAFGIISQLYSVSRIFTVISEKRTVGKMYDELYFKHGTLIRHIPFFDTSACPDAIIIRCEEKAPPRVNLPVIDMLPNPILGDMVVRVGEILIEDDSARSIQKLWGGSSGAAFYNIIGKMPSARAIVDIDKKSDEIFLLDTNVI